VKMSAGEGKIEPGVAIELSDEQKRARRLRNTAIAGCLLGLVVIFYVGTIVKMGSSAPDTQQSLGQTQ